MKLKSGLRAISLLLACITPLNTAPFIGFLLWNARTECTDAPRASVIGFSEPARIAIPEGVLLQISRRLSRAFAEFASAHLPSDQLGRVTTHQVNGGATTTVGYDALGRPNSITNPLGLPPLPRSVRNRAPQSGRLRSSRSVSFLVDANVLSEPIKPQPSANVVECLRS